MNDIEIRFGVYPLFQHNISTKQVTCIISLKNNDFLATSNRELVHLDKDGVKRTFPYSLKTIVYLENYNFIAGSTALGSQLVIYHLDSLDQALISNIPTGQTVFHMLYAPKSSCIITCGTGFKVWYLKLLATKTYSRLKPGDINVALRSSFAEDYSTGVFMQPVFNPDRETVFIPTNRGIAEYTLDGNIINYVTKLPAPRNLVFSYHAKSKKVISVEETHGLVLWDKYGCLVSRFNMSNSVVYVHFIDRENAVLITQRATICILNIKTERIFICYNLENIPTRVFFLRSVNSNILACSYGTYTLFLNINIPWSLWAMNVLNVVHIKRYPKLYNPARIAVLSNKALIKVFSPKNGTILTQVTPGMAATIDEFYYDRGVVVYKKKGQRFIETTNRDLDTVFCNLSTGKFVAYDMEVNPSKQKLSYTLEGRYVQLGKYKGKFCYILGTEQGCISIIDFSTYKPIKYARYSGNNMFGMRYIESSEELLLIFNNSCILIELINLKKVANIDFTPSKIFGVQTNLVFFGYKSGHLVVLSVENHEFSIIKEENTDFSRQFHSDAITAFDFADSYWISSGNDCKVKIWDYCFQIIRVIVLPLPIICCSILNGKRDLLVCTESEIMKISGYKLFNGEMDEEIKEIDNHDKLYDKFASHADFEEEEELREVSLSLQLERNENTNEKESENNYTDYELFSLCNRLKELKTTENRRREKMKRDETHKKSLFDGIKRANLSTKSNNDKLINSSSNNNYWNDCLVKTGSSRRQNNDDDIDCANIESKQNVNNDYSCNSNNIYKHEVNNKGQEPDKFGSNRKYITKNNNNRNVNIIDNSSRKLKYIGKDNIIEKNRDGRNCIVKGKSSKKKKPRVNNDGIDEYCYGDDYGLDNEKVKKDSNDETEMLGADVCKKSVYNNYNEFKSDTHDTKDKGTNVSSDNYGVYNALDSNINEGRQREQMNSETPNYNTSDERSKINERYEENNTYDNNSLIDSNKEPYDLSFTKNGILSGYLEDGDKSNYGLYNSGGNMDQNGANMGYFEMDTNKLHTNNIQNQLDEAVSLIGTSELPCNEGKCLNNVVSLESRENVDVNDSRLGVHFPETYYRSKSGKPDSYSSGKNKIMLQGGRLARSADKTRQCKCDKRSMRFEKGQYKLDIANVLNHIERGNIQLVDALQDIARNIESASVSKQLINGELIDRKVNFSQEFWNNRTTARSSIRGRSTCSYISNNFLFNNKGEIVAVIEQDGEIARIKSDHNDSNLVVFDQDGCINGYIDASGEIIMISNCGDQVLRPGSIVFSTDGELMGKVDDCGDIKSINKEDIPVGQLCFSESGDILGHYGEDCEIIPIQSPKHLLNGATFVGREGRYVFDDDGLFIGKFGQDGEVVPGHISPLSEGETAYYKNGELMGYIDSNCHVAGNNTFCLKTGDPVYNDNKEYIGYIDSNGKIVFISKLVKNKYLYNEKCVPICYYDKSWKYITELDDANNTMNIVMKSTNFTETDIRKTQTSSPLSPKSSRRNAKLDESSTNFLSKIGFNNSSLKYTDISSQLPLTFITYFKFPKKENVKKEAEEIEKEKVKLPKNANQALDIFYALRKASDTKIISARVRIHKSKEATPRIHRNSTNDLLEEAVTKKVKNLSQAEATTLFNSVKNTIKNGRTRAGSDRKLRLKSTETNSNMLFETHPQSQKHSSRCPRITRPVLNR